MSQRLRLEIEDQRATITLDRPDKHNMLELDDLAALEALIERVDADTERRVLVLTGAGGKSFCSGFAHGDVAATDWRDNPIERAIRRLEDCRLPTICALNGGVFGAAVDLALACDFRIGVEGMRLFVPAARLGVIYNESGLRRFLARLGPGPARRLLLAAEELDSDALLAIGFLDHRVAPEDLSRRTAALAGRLAALAPRAVQGMKRALVGIERGDLDHDWLAREILACFASDDLEEGLAAFADKRKPHFTRK
ncbi:MAG: enoyl-CoA hydratase/isomerase family protein [Alphaproteobacteria bacterium]